MSDLAEIIWYRLISLFQITLQHHPNYGFIAGQNLRDDVIQDKFLDAVRRNREYIRAGFLAREFVPVIYQTAVTSGILVALFFVHRFGISE